MTNDPNPPPQAYRDFVARFPQLGEAWNRIREAEHAGGLDENTRILIKLGAAMAAGRQGAVHSATRKALARGVTPEAIEQVVAVCASVLGMPGSVAAFTWVRDILDARE